MDHHRPNYMPSVGFFNAFIQQERNPIRILKSTSKQTQSTVVAIRPNNNGQQILTAPVSNFGILHPVIIRPIGDQGESIENVWQMPIHQLPNCTTDQLVTNGSPEPKVTMVSSCLSEAPASKRIKLGIDVNIDPESEPAVDIKSENDSNSFSDEATTCHTDDDNSIGSMPEFEEESAQADEDLKLKISNVVTLTPQELRRIKSSRPNHIKRPLNAFMAYSKVQRRKIMNEHPDMHHAAVSKTLGAIWKAFTPEEKQPFYDEAKKLAEEHLQKYPGYKYKPRPRKTKVEENFKPIPPVQAPGHSSVSLMPGKSNYNGVSGVKSAAPPGRISPSEFHAWSLIYESEEEEEEVEEEIEDSE